MTYAHNELFLLCVSDVNVSPGLCLIPGGIIRYVYASTHNTYTFKICVMVIRTHENAPLGMGFKIILM